MSFAMHSFWRLRPGSAHCDRELTRRKQEGEEEKKSSYKIYITGGEQHKNKKHQQRIHHKRLGSDCEIGNDPIISNPFFDLFSISNRIFFYFQKKNIKVFNMDVGGSTTEIFLAVCSRHVPSRDPTLDKPRTESGGAMDVLDEQLVGGATGRVG